MRSTRRLSFVALLLSLAGCAQGGALASLVARAVPVHVDAAYKGLAGQRTVVVVWSDRAVRQDYEDLGEDVAAALQQKLINVQQAAHPAALERMTFPFSTATITQVQADHPDWQYLSDTELAKKFRGTRLIYVEVTDFATRSAASLELYRGTMTAHLSVVEVSDQPDGTATAKQAYDGGTISIVFPKDTPQDGLPNRSDSQVGQGTVDAFAEQAAKRFYDHDEDRD